MRLADDAVRLPDPIERGECAAEQRFDVMTTGVPAGHYRCGCGNVTTLDDAHPVSANPYAEPCCGQCVEKMVNDER